jgi:biopolymer transport protein ExbB
VITYNNLHTLVFVLLYLVAFISTFVFFERLIFLYFSAPTEIKLLIKEAEGKASTESLYYSFSGKLSRGIGLLSSCITAAPLLGLLGTVIGIIESFQTMAQKGISDIAEVSKGIGTALEATALGIAIAILSLFYFTIVNSRINSLKTKLKSELTLIEKAHQ